MSESLIRKYLRLSIIGCAILLSIALCSHSATAQTFDIYGGDTAQTCTASAYFTMQKVGQRWYFCTAAGHVFIAQAMANMIVNSNPTYDCQTNTFNSTGATLSWVNQGPTYPNTYLACINVNNRATWTPAAVYQDGLNSGIKLTQESTISAVDATAGSWLYDGAGNLYVHTTTGDSPANHTTMNYPENTYNIYTAKYGDAGTNWAAQQLKRITSWKFNATGQDSGGNVEGWSTASSIKLPGIVEIKPAEYASENSCNCMQSPLKDIINGTNDNFKGWHGGAAYDDFDPGLNISFQYGLENNNAFLATNNPYVLAVFTDDSDYVVGMMNGPDFVAGNTSGAVNLGFATMLTSPVQTLNPNNIFAHGARYIYSDPQVYSKASATNPAHGTCSIGTPCSLRDYLYDKYSGVISGANSLDAAWGANYTQWDTTGTCFGYTADQNGGQICPNNAAQPAKSIGTGSGSAGQVVSACLGSGAYPSCTITTPISPASLSIYVGSTEVAGDCPWFEYLPSGAHCISHTTNQGTIYAPTNATTTVTSGSINYATGALTVTFGTALSNGAAITVKMITGGWMAGGTGLTDESGANQWVGGNFNCLEGADPGYPTYYLCNGQTGTLDYVALPDTAFQVSSITVSGATTTVNITASKPGGYTLANNQSVYLSGTPACDGGPYVISNTGNTATSFTIATPPGCTSTASAQGWVNTAFAHDMNNWISQLVARYFKTMHDDLRAIAPCVISKCWAGTKIPYFGVDNFGSYTFSKVFQGAAPYLYNGASDDGGAFIGLASYFKEFSLQPNEFLSAYQYMTHYLGDIPIFDSTQNPITTTDGAYACYGGTGFASTQSDAGQKWYTNVNDLQTTLSANNSYQVVGTSWWSYYDFQYIDQGLVSVHDNAYDGVESVNASVACDSSYTSSSNCGGEPANFGDATTQVTTANQVWTNLIAPSPQFSYAPSPLSFGTITVGSNSSLTTTIKNTGSANLVLGSLGAPTDPEFAVSSDLCSGTTIAANGTCTFVLTFTPTSAGLKSASISVPDNTGSSDSIAASGTGQSATNYTLTVAKAGAGLGTVTSTDTNINCGSVCSFSYPSGTQVTLNASPSSGSSFIGWTGGGCTTGTCIVTMTGNLTVTATFNQNTPPNVNRGRAKKLIF